MMKENNRIEYPDFLRKGTGYESQSILGQLFRRAKEFFQSHPELFKNDGQDASLHVRGRKVTQENTSFRRVIMLIIAVIHLENVTWGLLLRENSHKIKYST